MFHCLYLDITAQICIKPIESDAVISGSIKSGGAWEPHIVNSVITAMKRFPNALFLGEQIDDLDKLQADF